jgi:hypothetical protein
MIIDLIALDFNLRRSFDSVKNVKWSVERIEYVITQNNKKARVWFEFDTLRKEYEPGSIQNWGVENIDMDKELLETVEKAIMGILAYSTWRY